MDVTTKHISICIITDIQKYKEIWDLLSPKETIYDLWDVRFAFYKYFNFPLYGIAAYDGDVPVGFLGLEYNSEKNYYESFGTYFMETNRVFTAPGYDYVSSLIYSQTPKPTNLECLSAHAGLPESPIQDYKYILTLKTYTSFQKYWDTAFSSKRKKKFRKAFGDIENGHQVSISPGTMDDIETMFALNIKTFDEKFEIKGGRHSSFLYPHRMDTYRDLLNIPEITPLILNTTIDGTIQSVSLALLYKQWYLLINTGSNIHDIPNLGSYVYAKNIEHAFSLMPDILYFDAGVESYGWKEIFHLEKVPQYIYTSI